MPQSGASSTAPGSPRRSFYQPTMSSQTKMIKEHVNMMLSHPNTDNDSGNANIPTVSFHVPTSNDANVFGIYSPGYEGRGGHPVPHNNSDCEYDVSILRPSRRNYSDYPYHQNEIRKRTNGMYSNGGDVDVISHDAGDNTIVKGNENSKRFPLYQPSYNKSPHRKFYKIDNVKNSDTGFPPSQTFAWTCNNTEGCRYSSGLAFSVISGNPSDTVYQSLDSVRSFSPSKSTVVHKKRPNRDSGMTDREEHLEVHDEEDDDVVYSEPSNQTPIAAAQLSDHSQNGGSYICLNCQMIYGTNDTGTSALSPRSESDTQSTDIMNVSSDRFLTPDNRSNSECCTCIIL